MKKTMACLLFLSVLSFTPSAWGAWKFVTTGTTAGIGNPSCAEASAGLVACAVQSSKNTLMVNQFNGTAWGKWTSLPGAVSSDPTCTGDGAGNVFCASEAGGSLLVTIFNGTTWTKPAKVAGALYSQPSCAEYLAGQVLCMARGSGGNLTWSLYNGSSWSKFASLGVSTSAFSAPSCTTDNNSGVICAVFTTGYATLVNRFASGAWEGFLNIGGITAGNPDCTSLNSSGQVVCYGESYTSAIYGSRFDGRGWASGDWSTYSALGGEVNTNASCTSQAAGQQLCGVYGVGATYKNAFFVDIYNGSGWSSWSQVGGTGVGIPACAPLGGGQVVCAIMQPNSQLTSAVGP
jgi:hypothetical protein